MKDELEVFKSLKDINVIFDVGARTDENYYDLNPNSKIHYFEPNEEFAEKLVGGRVNNFGLSDVEGQAIYYPETQSFLMRQGIGIMYPLKTLDWYAKDIPIIDFLKIDAEGMDYKILQGGKETLKKVRYLQFEYWSGSRKFKLLLKDFDLYLILDSALKSVIKNNITKDEKYNHLMIPLDEDTINLIDDKLIPLGAGGNIFGIRK